MAEPRSRVYHRNRVAETLREEIGTMLEGQLSDPRIAFCYVTEVAMNAGSKSARVYIAVDGGEEAEYRVAFLHKAHPEQSHESEIAGKWGRSVSPHPCWQAPPSPLAQNYPWKA